MSAISAISPRLLAIRPPLRGNSHMIQASVKTQSLWERLRAWVGRCLRDAFFLPLSKRMAPEVEELFKRESDFATRFWTDPSFLDTNFPNHAAIKEAFRVYDQPIELQTETDQNIQVTCRVIESKNCTGKCYNFVHVMGNLATISNNIAGAYSCLSAYLAYKEREPSLPPFRCILISQYNEQKDGSLHKPATLDEAGRILQKTLEALSHSFGEIDHILAQSLGSIILASSLKTMSLNRLPASLTFDRSPSSIEASSKNYFLGGVLHRLAKWAGWSVDCGREIKALYDRGAKTECAVIGVKHDFFFPGSAGLHEHEEIKTLQREKKVNVLVFDPPCQLFHQRAHHGLAAHYLSGSYLVSPSTLNAMSR